MTNLSFITEKTKDTGLTVVSSEWLIENLSKPELEIFLARAAKYGEDHKKLHEKVAMVWSEMIDLIVPGRITVLKAEHVELMLAVLEIMRICGSPDPFGIDSDSIKDAAMYLKLAKDSSEDNRKEYGNK